MKRSRFTQEQTIGVLKEHQAGAPAAICATSMGLMMQCSRGQSVGCHATLPIPRDFTSAWPCVQGA